MKIAALTGGRNEPSARFRIGQLIDPLGQRLIEVSELPAFFGAFPPASSYQRPLWLAATLIERTLAVFRAHNYDRVIFQRELISTLPSVERLVRKSAILDVDDAIWLYRGGLAAANVSAAVDLIVCGNNYLAEYFSRYGKSIVIIPTGVDTQRFHPMRNMNNHRKVIGWSGTSGGFRFFTEKIESELAKLLKKNSDWIFRVVSDKPPIFKLINPNQIDYIPWSEKNEVESIASMDVGIMPLDNSDWCRGKCSYKMLLYMACGVPVVVSNIGMNREILDYAPIGIGVPENGDWYEALEAIMIDENMGRVFGNNGRVVVEERFSIATVANQWKDALNSK
jgi:glycosyltransferase involved in cell wall biosynthesis